MSLNSKAFDYALIIGNGRSGSNWLLTILDASSKTHCRNEPHHITSSPLHRLPSPQAIAVDDPETETRWSDFVQWTCTHMGERDHRIPVPKQYIHNLSQHLGCANWPMRPKIRSTLKIVLPKFRQGEWEIPWWIGNQQKLASAYHIFKLNDLPAWTVHWLFRNHPEIPIIHIIRHPGGQLYSGLKRFFNTLSPAQIQSEISVYKQLLQTAITLDSQWAHTIGNIDNMDLIELVAWFWRYNNEAIYHQGQSEPNYYCITYENMASEPVETAKQIYHFCGLPWTGKAKSTIVQGTQTSVWGQLTTHSQSIASQWKQKLPMQYQHLAQTVLETSVMKSWW